MFSILLCSSFLFICLSFITHPVAFSFGVSPPTQCDPFTISWTGGTPPYDIIITPAFDSPRKFSISSPDNGSFTVPQLPISAGGQFVVLMSDATGFATGGVSDLYTVGRSINGALCSTAVPSLSFTFQLPSFLQQCGPYNVTWDSGAAMPVNITGLIPLGKSVQFTSGTQSDFFIWDRVNIPSGTRIIFFVTDNEGRFGGSSHLLKVGESNDNSCIDAQSPQSTTAIGNPSGGNSGLPSPTSAPQTTVTVAPTKGTSAAAIGGAVAGGLVACLILGTLATFFFRTYLPSKRNTSRHSQYSSFYGHSNMPGSGHHQPHSGNPLSQMSPGGGSPSTAHWTTFSSSEGLGVGSEYVVEPLAPSAYERYPQSASGTGVSRNVSSAGLTTYPVQTTSTLSKSSMDYPPNRPARFILHIDAEDEQAGMPPQYNGHLTSWQSGLTSQSRKS